MALEPVLMEYSKQTFTIVGRVDDPCPESESLMNEFQKARWSGIDKDGRIHDPTYGIIHESIDAFLLFEKRRIANEEGLDG